MEFTKENWENAPEGSKLQCTLNHGSWEDAYFIGYSESLFPVVEDKNGEIFRVSPINLRIILPTRKVTVQLWRNTNGAFTARLESSCSLTGDWTLLGEHTFEVEGE